MNSDDVASPRLSSEIERPRQPEHKSKSQGSDQLPLIDQIARVPVRLCDSQHNDVRNVEL